MNIWDLALIMRLAPLILLFPAFGVVSPQDSPDRFLIRIENGMATGTEEFKIEKFDSGYRLTGTTRFTESGVLAIWTQDQVLAADWSPVSYRLDRKALDHAFLEVSKEGDQFQIRGSSNAFTRRNQSVPVRPRTVILDDIVASHFQVLLNAIASDKESKPEWRCLVPQTSSAIECKLLETKNESGTLNGKTIQVRKYSLQAGDMVREFWAEADTHRLMQAFVPIPKIEMVREGFALIHAAADSDNPAAF